MPIATGLALGLAGLSAAGALGGAAIASSGATNAANAQVGAANNAAQLQYQSGQNALDFAKQQYGNTQQEIAPWLASGRGALSSLDNLMGIAPGTTASGGSDGPGPAGPTALQTSGLPASQTLPNGGSFNPRIGTLPFNNNGGRVPLSALQRARTDGGPTNPLRSAQGDGAAIPGVPGGVPSGTQPGAAAGGPGTPGFGSLLQGYDKTFTAPTDVTEQNDPGYKFRLSQGLDALQNSAAARGGLLSGGTAKDLENYSQNYASNEYGNVYNRALGEYQQGYNIFQQNQNNQFNRLASLSGMGQTAAGQLSSAGQAASGNVSNILLGSAGQIGQSLQNAGAARASGYAAGSNALGGAVGSGLSNLQQLLLLTQYPGAHASG